MCGWLGSLNLPKSYFKWKYVNQFNNLNFKKIVGLSCRSHFVCFFSLIGNEDGKYQVHNICWKLFLGSILCPHNNPLR